MAPVAAVEALPTGYAGIVAPTLRLQIPNSHTMPERGRHQRRSRRLRLADRAGT